MRFLPLLPLAALALAACSGPPPCPKGWSGDDKVEGECSPSKDESSAVKARIGTGIFGFARETGGSTPGPPGTGSSHSTFIVNAKVSAFVKGAAKDAVPVGSAITDGNGSYELSLPPGSYTIKATLHAGPVDVDVVVPPNSVVSVPLVLEGCSVAC